MNADMEKLHSCTSCSKSFRVISSLNRHILTHTGEKTHTCEICNKSFRQAGDVKRHLLTHTGDKPHTCTICNISFGRADDVKRHLLTHTGEKPHTCEICNRSFAEARNMKRHLLTHTGEKPHACKICNKSFALVANLKQHLLTHTGEKSHTCEICARSFTKTSGLKSHLVTHTGEKPHTCKICYKNFAKTDNLKSHLLTHTGAKPHTCEICYKSFAWVSSLRNHLRTHTAKKLLLTHSGKASPANSTFHKSLSSAGHKSTDYNMEYNILQAEALKTNIHVESNGTNVHKINLKSFAEPDNFTVLIKEEYKLDEEFDENKSNKLCWDQGHSIIGTDDLKTNISVESNGTEDHTNYYLQSFALDNCNVSIKEECKLDDQLVNIEKQLCLNQEYNAISDASPDILKQYYGKIEVKLNDELILKEELNSDDE